MNWAISLNWVFGVVVLCWLWYFFTGPRRREKR